MKWVFDNSTKLVGLLSLALLVVSTVHDWAYFLVIGSKFRSIQTTYDYITSAIEWLPTLLWFGIVAASLGIPASWMLGSRDEFGFENQKSIYWKRRFTIVKVAMSGLSIVFFLGSLFEPYPDNLMFLAGTVGLGVLIFPFSSVPESLLKPRLFAVIATSAIIAVVFAEGIGDGLAAMYGTAPPVYKIGLKGGETKQASVLRSFEKGVLIWSPSDESVHFIRWDQIEDLSHHVREEQEASGCRFSGWFCKESFEP